MLNTEYLKNDFFAGLVVFLVSLPLCLGIALASDAPLFSGIIAGIIGGMVVTVFSRCTLGVSGPAAGLAVIVAQAVGQLGFEAFLLATMVAGVIQITAGFLRLGIISHYFPSSVIKGRWQFIPFIVTVGALVFTDMLTGVILGLAVGAFHILLYNYKVDYLLEKRADNTYTLHLSEYMSFLNKAGVMNVLRDIPANSMVTVDASRTEIIDSDVHEVISNFVKRAKGENITIEWKGLEGKDL